MALTDGLVGYWKMNEGTGSTTADSAGALTGTLVASPNWVIPGNSRIQFADPYCLQFNGTTQCVTLPKGTTLTTGTGNYSWSFWFKRNIATGSTEFLIWNATGAANVPSYSIFFTATTGVVNFFVRDGSSNQITATTTTTYLDKNWHHVVYVKKGTSVFGYIDNILVASGTNSSLGTIDITAGSTKAPRIGAGASDPDVISAPFSGLIDEVRFYNRAITLGEIDSLSNGGNVGPRNLTLLSDGLVGNWPLNDTSSPAKDATGYGQVGTWTNSPTSSTSVPTNIFSNINRSIQFAGTTDYVTITKATTTGLNNRGTSTMTVSSWIYLTSNWNASGSRIISTDNALSVGWLYIGYQFSSTNVFGFSKYGATTSGFWDARTNPLTKGIWYHVVVTYDGSSNSNVPIMYINGVSVTVTTSSQPTGGGTDDSSNPLLIGNVVSGIRGFPGRICDVRIYNRILSANDVQTLAAGTNPTSQILSAQIKSGSIK